MWNTLMFADEANGTWPWVQTLFDAVKTVLWPALILVCAAGMIYSIILGVNMARADSTEKREEAKKRLINVLIGIAITVALILFFELLVTVILPSLLPGLQS